MDIKKWLKSIGLEEYSEAFENQGIESKDLSELTNEELKEDLGISKLGHRKKLLKAIAELSIASDEISLFIDTIPSIIALPLQEYQKETHPNLKLWSICDTIEMLLRFLMAIMVADRKQHGDIDDKALKEIWGKIEMPTLGAWLVMTRSIASTKSKGALLVPEIDEFVLVPLSNLLYGPSRPGTPETSLLALRNQLAHGGGMTQTQAEKLFDIWKDPFEQIIQHLQWLSEIHIIVLDESGAPQQLIGTDKQSITLNDELVLKLNDLPAQSAIWVKRENNLLPLWPLTVFSKPVAPAAGKAQDRQGDNEVPQVYMRKDLLNLQYTPMGDDQFSQSHASGDAVEAFQQVFQLDKSQRLLQAKNFKVQGFEREIRKDASEMVGREAEVQQVKKQIAAKEQGLYWLTGSAGMGKSFLVARIITDLIDEFNDTDTLILPYRFRSGDDARCNRDAFVNFIIERLEANKALIEGGTVKKDGKAEERLKSALDGIQRNKKIIIIIDGLDELLGRDSGFVSDIPASLRYLSLTWVCAGRPEPALVEAFKIGNATEVFPEGLPPMSSKDIRSMILEKIGPLRKKLVGKDQEKEGIVVNPFIERVAKRAEGLPLYVKYVIGDVLSGAYQVDKEPDLPDSLHAYHEDLLRRLGIGDLQSILTPLAATLAVAREPLSQLEIKTFLILRKLISDDVKGSTLLSKALAAITTMLRTAPDPEGEVGFTLFHKSLRDHILITDSMVNNVELTKQAFSEAALEPEKHQIVSNYLYRSGIDHLIEADDKDQAQRNLLNLDHLGKMFYLGKEDLDILHYWNQIDSIDYGKEYISSFESFIEDEEFDAKKLKTIKKMVSFLNFSGRYDPAKLLAEKTIDIHMSLLGENHIDTLACMEILANILQNLACDSEVISIHEKIVDTMEEVLGPDHPETLKSKLKLLYSRIGDIKSIGSYKNLYCKIYNDCKQIHGDEHPDTVKAHMCLATFFLLTDKVNTATNMMRENLKMCQSFHGFNHEITRKSMVVFSYVLMRKNAGFEESESLLLELVKLQNNIFGNKSLEVAGTIEGLAFLLGKQKQRRREAFNLYLKLYEIRRNILGENHPEATKVNRIIKEMRISFEES